MPTHAAFSVVRPAYFMHGGIQGQVNFPMWLGQNSKRGKSSRLLKEIQLHMRTHVSGDRLEIRQTYLPVLLSHLTQPLLAQGIVSKSVFD